MTVFRFISFIFKMERRIYLSVTDWSITVPGQTGLDESPAH